MRDVEKVNCNFCKSDNCRTIYSEGILKLVRCNVCSFDYVNPRLKKEALLDHYDDKFKLGTETARRKLKDVCEGQRVVTDSSNWTSKEWNALNKWLVHDLRRVMKYKKTGRLLDVGCGEGERLKVAFENGWSDLYGLELSDSAIENVKKRLAFDDDRRFKNSTILDSGFPDNFFDVITYWSVLEHVVDPLENLKKAYDLLKKDGLIVIRVPNVREEFLRKYQGNLAKFILPRKVKILCGIEDLRPIRFKEIFDLTRGTSGKIGSLELELHVNHFSDKTMIKFLKSRGFRLLENGNGEEPFSLQKVDAKMAAKMIARFLANIPYYCTFRKMFNFSEGLFFIARKI